MTQPQPHFLRLPYAVRRRIYHDLWLILDDPSPLPLFPRAEWSSREQKIVRENEAANYFTNQLFYVSRAISEDARATLYSENCLWFDEEQGRWGGLETILHLTPLGWKSLRSIVVTIGTKGCHCSFYEGDRSPYKSSHEHASVIIKNDRQLEARGVLSTWRSICSKLAAYNTEADRFELRLVCGAASQGTAAQFLAPLHRLPRLKGLSVRMGPRRDFDLQHLIMATIRVKTQYFAQDPEGPFDFQRLPVDIQLCILEYSGLVAPKALISCDPCEPFMPTDCRDFNCAGVPGPFGYGNCKDSYCPSMHTAFSTVWQCCAPPIPHALFLVNKAVRELALNVYYTRNIIEIWYMPSAEFPAPLNTSWAPHTSEFLSRVPTHSWKSLRHIHWVMPHMPPTAFHTGTGEADDWMNTLKTLFEAVQPSASAMTLQLSFIRPTWADLNLDPRSNAEEWALYGRVLEPVLCLRSLLKDFFVHIFCHWYTNQDARSGPERALERIVMGAQYDGRLRGKVYPNHFQHPVFPNGEDLY
ncbi:hypothetical protein BJX99DRAFT_226501 [Aspergillus californicus]